MHENSENGCLHLLAVQSSLSSIIPRPGGTFLMMKTFHRLSNLCFVDKYMSALSGSNGLKDYGPQIRSWTSKLDSSLILDILSTWTTCISYLQQNNTAYPYGSYCVLPFLCFYCSNILIVLWTLCSHCSHSFRLILLIVQDLDSLLFHSGHSHAIVLCRTIAHSCISSVTCTP